MLPSKNQSTQILFDFGNLGPKAASSIMRVDKNFPRTNGILFESECFCLSLIRQVRGNNLEVKRKIGNRISATTPRLS